MPTGLNSYEEKGQLKKVSCSLCSGWTWIPNSQAAMDDKMCWTPLGANTQGGDGHCVPGFRPMLAFPMTGEVQPTERSQHNGSGVSEKEIMKDG